jgi:hypothetical protein
MRLLSATDERPDADRNNQLLCSPVSLGRGDNATASFDNLKLLQVSEKKTSSADDAARVPEIHCARHSMHDR